MLMFAPVRSGGFERAARRCRHAPVERLVDAAHDAVGTLPEHVLGKLREALRREQRAEAALAASSREVDDRLRAFDRRALRRVTVRLVEGDENRMPERTRRFHQAGEKPCDDAALSGETEIVELKDRRDAEFEQRDRQLAGGAFAEWRKVDPADRVGLPIISPASTSSSSTNWVICLSRKNRA